jgi:galacturan 1,4-alpha-galacturonidase
MRLSPLFLASLVADVAFASSLGFPNGAVPAGASIEQPRSAPYSAHLSARGHSKKDNWGNALEQYRRTVTIRASRNDTDDISSDFLWALKKANHGGMVHLEKDKTYVIGTKLDLTFLKDVYVKIDGELKVRLRIHSLPYFRSGPLTTC